jgi:hypothetical protein
MRSIGKVNIRKLQKIVDEERTGGIPGLQDRVLRRIPDAWYDIWESAYDEIHRLVDDMAWATRD